MQFVLFTDKTVNQCMRALNERMQAKPTSSRPEIDGWVEKSGRFSLAMTSPVLGKFRRRTRLRATAERENGTTIIRGFVPNGVSQRGLHVIFGVLELIAASLISRGNTVMAAFLVVVGVGLCVPLIGDYRNHDILLYELEKTLKAKPTPPKPSPSKRSTAKKKK